MNILNLITPKIRRKIFVYDSQYIGFNEIALVNYLVKNQYTSKYKIIYFVKKPFLPKKLKGIHNVYVTCNIFKALWHRLTAKYVFCEQVDYIFASKPAHNQIIMSLWHGFGLKVIGYESVKKKIYYKLNETFTYMLCYSEFAMTIMKKSYHFSDDQAYIGGNPRNDMLFTSKDCYSMLGISHHYSKIVFCLPTFRNSSKCSMTDSDIDFPILNSNNIDVFNEFLLQKNVLLIIKLHPLQNMIKMFDKKYSHIRIISDRDFYNVDCEFYELLGQVDALLSDYSSVFYDFLLTRRPIGFVVDDIVTYQQNRGFNVDNPLDYMPGHKIYTLNDLKGFVEDLISGKDEYIQARKEINDLVNKYQDHNNCKRLLDFLNITME